MTDLEDRIADELRTRAERTDVPPAPVDRLLAAGRATRRHRRRRTQALAAVAAVVAVGLAIGVPALVHRDGTSPGPVDHPTPTPSVKDPKTLDELPAGRAPVVPYLHEGALHVGQVVVPTTADQVVSAGGTVLVGRTRGEDRRWWLLVGTQLRPVPQLDGAAAPRLEPSGDVAVWTSYPDASTTRVTAWSPATRQEVGHVDLAAPYAACCGGGQLVELLGVDDDGAVYWRDSGSASQPPAAYAWVPGDQPRRLVGVGDSPGITPLGPITASGTYGDVAPDGRFRALGHLADPHAVWEGGGNEVAIADGSSVVVLRMDTGHTFPGPGVRMALPAGAEVTATSFESSDQLLVRVRGSARRHLVVRCPTDGGACERALDMPTPSRWVLPQPLS
jgi:hypothetical protein